MEWDRIEANWQHFKVIARVRWNRISADQFDVIGGQRERLAAQITEAYGVSAAMAQMQLESWQGQQNDAPPAGPSPA
jgi:uncharacterized protein YjbJ (UPF0337 family)